MMSIFGMEERIMKNGKKKKTLIAVLIIVLLITVLIIKFPLKYAFYEYMIWNGEGVHDDGWKEMLYAGTIWDRASVNTVMEKAEEAFSAFPQSREEAYERFGKLGTFCITEYGGDAVSEKHTLKLISANVNADKGYMWVRYSQEGYDENGKVVCGSWDISSRWTIEKNSSGEWEVTAIHEHP